MDEHGPTYRLTLLTTTLFLLSHTLVLDDGDRHDDSLSAVATTTTVEALLLC